MRLASTSLQDASREVLSAQDQCEVRFVILFDNLVKTDSEDSLKVFDNPHAVCLSVPRGRRRTIDEQSPSASRTQPILS